MPIFISGSNGISGVDGTAAAPAVQGTDTNTGVFFPAADQVALAANGTQVLLGTSTGASVGGNLSFNSGFGSAAVAYGCRAWVNFNGTGTIAIRGSANVSSITDGGVGVYVANFTNAMPDGNYACHISIGPTSGGFVAGLAERHITSTLSTTNATVYTADVASGLTDSAQVSVAIFR